MSERDHDRWLPMLCSVGLHVAIAGSFIYGWLLWKPPARWPQVLAIDATVVDARTLSRITQRTEPAPPNPSPPQSQPAKPAEPSQEELAQRAAAERTREARAEAERKRQAEKEAAEKAEAERQARAAEAKAKATAAAKVRAEAELRRRLAEEERVSRAQASGLQDRWVAQIQARIERAWIRPPSAKPGLDCTVQVTQVPGGEVVGARVATCNGDQAVRQSIEAAVLRASPLPEPPDPALFVRDLEVRFHPND